MPDAADRQAEVEVADRARVDTYSGSTRQSMRCPTCNSPAPHFHPAVQCEGEVQPCGDPWHRSTPEGAAALDKLPEAVRP